MTQEEDVWRAFHEWYQGLPLQKNGLPTKGTIGGALQVLENLLDHFDLRIEAHKTENQGQVKGVGGPQLKHILHRYGEDRTFLNEGGRTSRGLLGYMDNFLIALDRGGLGSLTPEARARLITELQSFLVEQIRNYFALKRLVVEYNPTKTTWDAIHALLASAHETGKDGPVAEYLVGAKLQARFPDIAVRNTSYSTADEQFGQRGDFEIGSTIFHVTVSPTPGHYEKCRRNLQEGFRVYLLVPASVVVGTWQNAEVTAAGRISVQSIESFVAQNLDEMSGFRQDTLPDELLRILEIYNQRTDAVESDKSMLIEIPPNLRA